MELTGLHILLTYTCNYECDHCFVWGSPWQTGTFTLAQLDDVFRQAKEVGTIREIYFEGGEAFLYYPILVEGVSRAKKLGFATGIVSNGYWATQVEDAWHWLQPLAAAGLNSLDISYDTYHGQEIASGEVHPALAAAKELFLSSGSISVDPPVGFRDPAETEPGLPLTGGGVMFRGRAAAVLTEGLPRQPWTSLRSCPYENLSEPGRLHLDPFGNLHLCQGLIVGNLFEQPLKQILAEYEPERHPIAGPLLAGGPAQLVEDYELDHEAGYVDACHLCYRAREALRSRFPAELGPDQMYGQMGEP
ncbi:MAG: radical SAM protein [Candidatus Promineifilaceae bacterium]